MSNEENNIPYLSDLGFKPSAEQYKIINMLNHGINTIVSAVAGAGKTSIVLALASMTKKKILHITYNKELKEENKKKAEKYHLHHLVHSFTIHGLAYYIARLNHLNITIKTDNDVKKFLYYDWKFNENFDFFIIDEVQDVNETMMLFIKRVYDSFKFKPTLLILGDNKQMLYVSEGASSCYLKDFDKFMHISMQKATLSTSFRVPENIANTLNTSFIKNNLLNAYFSGGKTTIYAINEGSYKTKMQEVIKQIVSFIQAKMQNENATYGDFFVLGYSIKASEFKDIATGLVNYGINVYYPFNDNQKSTKTELENKVAFCSMNQSKGRERKYVILPIFDHLHFANWITNPINAKNYLSMIPNLHYVALTRATVENFIIFNTKRKYQFKKILNIPPYIDLDNLTNDEHVMFLSEIDIDKDELPLLQLNEDKVLKINENKNNLSINFDNFTRFIDDSSINQAINQLHFKKFKKEKYFLRINNTFANTDVSYNQQVLLLNNIFFTLNYLFSNKNSAFRLSIKNYIYEINKQIKIELDHKTIYDKQTDTTKLNDEPNLFLSLVQQFDLEQINDNINDFWFNAPNNKKLLFLSLYLYSQLKNAVILQLPNFDWLNDFSQYKDIQSFFQTLNWTELNHNLDLFGSFSSDECTIYNLNNLKINIKPFQLDKSNIKFSSTIDLLSENCIYNLKCDVNAISSEDILKVVCQLYFLNEIANNIMALNQHYGFKILEDEWNSVEPKARKYLDTINLKLHYKAKTQNEMYLVMLNALYHYRKNSKLNSNPSLWKQHLLNNGYLTHILKYGYVVNYQLGKIVQITYDKTSFYHAINIVFDAKMNQNDLDVPFESRYSSFQVALNDIYSHLVPIEANKDMSDNNFKHQTYEELNHNGGW